MNPEFHDLVEVSVSNFIDNSVLIMDLKQAASCDSLSSQTAKIGLVYDQIRSNAVIKNDQARYEKQSVPLEVHNPESGALPSTLNSTLFKAVQLEIFSPITDSETPDAAFERVFSRHIQISDKLVIIDPWAGKNLLDSSSVLRRLLVKYLTPAKNLQIEIHTKIDAPDWDKTLSTAENLTIAQNGLCAVIDSVRSTWPTRSAGMRIVAYRPKGLLRDAINIDGVRSKEVKFTHDRHFEFTLIGDGGSTTVSDYFSLGNGVDIFMPDEGGAAGVAGAQTYSSDINRVWAWRVGERQKALISGEIVIEANQFGNSQGQIQFKRLWR